MGMSDFYGSSDDAVNRQVLSSALQQQVTLWDTADMYGPFTNETLLVRFFKENPGTRSLRRLAENAAAVEIELGSDMLTKLDEAIASVSIYGDRYPEGAMALLMGGTPERINNG